MADPPPAPAKPTLKARLKTIAEAFEREIAVYKIVLKDERTPRMARWLLGLAVGYALLPIDLIPDVIPVLGHLDDLIIVPGLVIWALRSIPPEVVADARAAVAEAPEHDQNGEEG